MKPGRRIPVRRIPVPRTAAADWAALAAAPALPRPFDTSALSALPEPARRWLGHAIAPGAPVCAVAELRMDGQIRLGGKWCPFAARQIIAPGRGFVWAARARVAGLPVSGFDRYLKADTVMRTAAGTAAAGQMRWRLLGLLPVMSAQGPDTTRSAAGRLAGEGIFVPTACLSAGWSAGAEAGTAVMTWQLGDQREDCLLRVGPGGELREVVLQRWGNPDGAGYGRYPFGVAVEEEAAFAGLRLPAVIRAGWWWGTDRQDEGEFFRARITQAVFS
jgi:hypothetical protein